MGSNITIIKSEHTLRLDDELASNMASKVRFAVADMPLAENERFLTLKLRSGYSSPFCVVELHLTQINKNYKSERVHSWAIYNDLTCAEFERFENNVMRYLVERRSNEETEALFQTFLEAKRLKTTLSVTAP